MSASFKEKTDQTLETIRVEYQRSQLDWHVGFSGGKDSSALIVLLFNALLKVDNRSKPINIIYCDTGVDIPTVSAQVKSTLASIEAEAQVYGLPIKIKIARPELSERFFVKVIGRGYPPPTNIFRWCTRRLRIAPIQKAISDSTKGNKHVILLGLRSGESQQRDRAISTYSTENEFYFRHSHNENSLIFSPIINYDVEEVWATIIDKKFPSCIDAKQLMSIYKDAAGECPVIRDPRGSPCGKGRFGCWTCTVIRKDKAVTSMVAEGHQDLSPLLDFRNWLVAIRDLPEFRCKNRRNGARGPGPITLNGRKLILQQLYEAQRRSGYLLITDEEINEIEKLWLTDLKSDSYNSLCEDTKALAL